MTDRIPFDNLDRQMLARFDSDVEINSSGDIAVITDCKIEIVRVADDKLELTVKFSELDFPILLLRAKTLEQLNIAAPATDLKT